MFCFVFRSVSASYEKSIDLKGINLYRYTLLASTLASPTVNPDNKCFCTNPTTTRNCTLAGVLDIAPCKDCEFAFWELNGRIRALPEYPCAHGFLPHPNSDTYLHLSAALPSRQSIPAGGRTGSESQRGAPQNLLRRGTCESLTSE